MKFSFARVPSRKKSDAGEKYIAYELLQIVILFISTQCNCRFRNLANINYYKDSMVPIYSSITFEKLNHTDTNIMNIHSKCCLHQMSFFCENSVCDLVIVLAIIMSLVCSLNFGQNNYLVYVFVKLQEMAQYLNKYRLDCPACGIKI